MQWLPVRFRYEAVLLSRDNKRQRTRHLMPLHFQSIELKCLHVNIQTRRLQNCLLTFKTRNERKPSAKPLYWSRHFLPLNLSRRPARSYKMRCERLPSLNNEACPHDWADHFLILLRGLKYTHTRALRTCYDRPLLNPFPNCSSRIPSDEKAPLISPAQFILNINAFIDTDRPASQDISLIFPFGLPLSGRRNALYR